MAVETRRATAGTLAAPGAAQLLLRYMLVATAATLEEALPAREDLREITYCYR